VIAYKNIYFIGIGGIGMSAIARMIMAQGAKISGSDMSESDVTRGLQDLGVVVNFEQVAENLSGGTTRTDAGAGVAEGAVVGAGSDVEIDCVVYTTAIGEDNPEFVEAKKRGLPIFKYAEMLGQLSKGMETIAVSGTHGKTTVTAMISKVFAGVGLEPHTIVGSLLPELKSNYVKGGDVEKDGIESGGNILITEACEYKRSFLNLEPSHVVITNIDEDHLDYYSDLADIQSAFISLCEKLPEDGKIICDPSLPNLAPIVEKFEDKVVDYKNFLSDVPEVSEMKVIGEHNRLNAAAALAVVSIFVEKFFDEGSVEKMHDAQTSLSEFSGTWRRLENRGESENGAILYDDYAHHPDEILAGIKALRGAFPDKKLCIFFQPHLYSRTKILFDDFVKVFSATDGDGKKYIDELYLLPIYAAREPADPEIYSEILVEKTGATFVENFVTAAEIAAEKNAGSVVVTMGAGDVYRILDLVV